MDFKNVRFCVNDQSNIRKILANFEIFTKKDINNLHYDLLTNAIPTNGILLIISNLNLLFFYKNHKERLLDFLKFNKILSIDDFDNENFFRDTLRFNHENLHNVSEDPFLTDRIYIPSLFLTIYDYTGVGLLDQKSHHSRKPTFFSLMNKSRLHRDLLVKNLYDKKILTKGKIVYHECNDNEIIPLLYKQSKFQDLNNFNEPTHNWYDGQIGPDYLDYSLEVVVETSCDFIFPTEKVVRPLLAGMPFLIIAAPKFLEYLHSLGFETYNTFIDESYDNELDLNKRIDNVTGILSQLQKRDFVNIYHKSRDIALHNLETLVKIKETHNFIVFEKIYNWIKNL